ncbi:MAG: 50S ribosomal protein L24 [Anaerolineae bacterium]
MNRIKKGDTVEVISGNDRGLRGKVQQVRPGKKQVVVSGVNIVKKHQRPMRAGRREVQPGIIEFEAPIHSSNVMLVCPECKKRTRVGFEQDGERKVRVCKKCGEKIQG